MDLSKGKFESSKQSESNKTGIVRVGLETLSLHSGSEKEENCLEEGELLNLSPLSTIYSNTALAVTQERYIIYQMKSRSLTALEITDQTFDNLGRVVEEMMSSNCSNLNDITANWS